LKAAQVFTRRGQLTVAALLAALYVIALVLPAVTVGSGPELSGFTLLRRGWEAGEYGIYSWYANPLMLVVLIVLAAGFARVTAIVATLSLILALTSLAAGDLARAAGLPVSALTFRAGFYIWLAVPALATAYSCTALLRVRRSQRNHDHRKP
jgi:heme exporter protein D